MAADDNAERTEEATQTRREEFRKRGQVANSRELSSALFILVSVLSIFMLSRFFFQQLHEVFNYTLGPDLVSAVRSGDLLGVFRFAGIKLAILLSPILGIALVIGVSSTLVQTGLLNVEDALQFKFERLNPVDGFKRIFSLKNLVEGIKALLKLLLVFGIAYLVVKSEIPKIPVLIESPLSETMQYIGEVIVRLLVGIGMAMIVLSGADYFFQRWDLEKQMRMTKQEVKEEHKSREGDPLIKARIRKVQRDLANRRMMEKVPQADVIVTNPTHIAVALQYNDNLPAPKLLAKGADLIAEKIRKIAIENNIPIVENKPLARTIYKTLKIGQIIPRELFVAVAEVLSYVYRLRKKVKK